MRKQVLILVVFKSGDLAGIQNNSHPSSFIAILAARLCWDWSLSIMNLFIPRLRDRNMTCSSLLCATKRLTVKLECLSRRVFVNFRIALNFVSRSVSGERWAVVSVPVTWQIRKIQQIPSFNDEHFHAGFSSRKRKEILIICRKFT
jgi:hypothetical protein